MEILAIKIKLAENIKGIEVNLEEIKQLKITQLADDTTLCVKNKIELSNALHIVDEFGLYSGFKLDKNITEALLIGSSKHNLQASIAGIKCATMVKALGVYFGHDKKECEHLNWEDKIKSCINSINN